MHRNGRCSLYQKSPLFDSKRGLGVRFTFGSMADTGYVPLAVAVFGSVWLLVHPE